MIYRVLYELEKMMQCLRFIHRYSFPEKKFITIIYALYTALSVCNISLF